ncbi:hydroxyacid dehydrogenase [Halomonas huangheensis]|uniref:2-hydroxyacid dehydrogenase n=1 Tax=Halomonas huangheensis TaxID=1178482 RepID=W1ND00_9GAMM|nr:hydroxyacid dehydrogenase [Halomonas huangheensis]ALM52645.1 hypothetical protein AR456_10410 [Halomonas huangheensis]ERL52835.1 hypothetical protein BJB45_16280 [Halomonas huangheensis]
MTHTDGSHKVLITRARIDEKAVEMLAEHGFECIFSPPYASPAEVAERLRETGAQALMVSQGQMTREVILASDALKIVVKHGSGVNNINLGAAESLNIPVYRSLGANARAVAEQAITLSLALWKSLPRLDTATRSGNWLKGEFIGRDIQGAVIGLVGFGAIGREVANMALALGMKVQVLDPAFSESLPGIERVMELETLLATSDMVSLHCPLTPQTRHLINAERLRLMKRESVLVNTARGGVVDEQALAEALHEGIIAGAALDSFEVEPPAADLPLWQAPNLIATPHAAGLTPGAERAMAMTAAQHIIDHFAGCEIDARFRATQAALGGLEE